MKRKEYFLALAGGLAPIVVLTGVALSQLGEYSYTKLGAMAIYIQAGYVVLLLLAMIALFMLRKQSLALGVLTSFGVGFFVAIITFGMGL